MVVPARFRKALAISGIAACKSAAAATRSVFFCAKFVGARQLAASIASNALPSLLFRGIWLSPYTGPSPPQNHHFGGLDQCRRPFAGLQPHFLGCVSGNDGSDVLLANRQRHLRKNPAVLDGHHAPNQLIAPTDFAKLAAPQSDLTALQFLWNQPVDFAFRHAVMSSWCLRGLYFPAINPLF